MASKYLNSKWTAPSLPLTSSWLYLLTMKVYDTPEWLDGIFWSLNILVTLAVVVVLWNAKFVDPVIKE